MTNSYVYLLIHVCTKMPAQMHSKAKQSNLAHASSRNHKTENDTVGRETSAPSSRLNQTPSKKAITDAHIHTHKVNSWFSTKIEVLTIHTLKVPTVFHSTSKHGSLRAINRMEANNTIN